MNDFDVIPVLDLMDGCVVHGKAGARDSYNPIESPFGPANDPLAIAKGLVEYGDADMLYIADLDAIGARGDHGPLCREIAEALPDIDIWVDAGFRAAEPARLCLKSGITPVIGSESLSQLSQWATICAAVGDDLVLSLDFDEDGFRGPDVLLSDPKLWPSRIIVMTLIAVGSGAGPDLARLTELRRSVQRGSAVYAAGGVRNMEDLEKVEEAGASGALIATALHRGTLPQKEIAAFRRRRRLSVSNTTP